MNETDNYCRTARWHERPHSLEGRWTVRTESKHSCPDRATLLPITWAIWQCSAATWKQIGRLSRKKPWILKQKPQGLSSFLLFSSEKTDSIWFRNWTQSIVILDSCMLIRGRNRSKETFCRSQGGQTLWENSPLPDNYYASGSAFCDCLLAATQHWNEH